jgi:DNA-binding XRE family transcriptional regulator
VLIFGESAHVLALRTPWLSGQVCSLFSSGASAQQAGRTGFFVLLLTFCGPHSPRGAVVPSRQSRQPLPANHEAALRLVGTTIRQQRKQQRLSQQTLAALTGLDSSYISEIERGQRNVSLLSLLRIAEALHLPVSRLLAPLDTL